MKFEDAIAEAIEEGDVEATYIECLTLDHSVLSDPIRVAKAFESFSVDGKVYQAFPFKLRKPSIEEGANSVMSIDIDDAGAEIMQSVHQASRTEESVTVLYEEYQHINNVFTLAASFLVEMDIADVSRSVRRTESGIAKVLTIRCEHVNLINQSLAHVRYLASEFPGLLQ